MNTLKNTLPSTWEEQRVDKLFTIQQGKQVSKKNREGSNQRHFLRTKNVYWGNLILDELDSMNFTADEERKLKLQTGDLLVCEGGDIGRTAIWEEQLKKCYYQNHLHRLRVLDGKIIPDFGLYWFWYAFNVGKVYFGRGNVTTIPNLSRSKLAELPIILPPLSEQRKVAAVLSTVQNAIEIQTKLIERTNELKKTMMQKLFSEGTRGEKQKMTEIGPVPESWEVKPLSESITKTQYGISSKCYESGIYPVLRMTNQKNGKIENDNLVYCNLNENEFKNFKVEKGDILFNRTNSFELVGRTAIFHLDGDYTFASYLIRIKTNQDILNPFYLNAYFNSDETQKRLKTIATRAVSQSNISATRLSGFNIPLPSLDEQTEITYYLSKIENKIDFHLDKKQKLEEFFRTFLHKLMTAEIRVDEVELDL